jgi:hypothetical protein
MVIWTGFRVKINHYATLLHKEMTFPYIVQLSVRTEVKIQECIDKAIVGTSNPVMCKRFGMARNVWGF